MLWFPLGHANTTLYALLMISGYQFYYSYRRLIRAMCPGQHMLSVATLGEMNRSLHWASAAFALERLVPMPIRRPKLISVESASRQQGRSGAMTKLLTDLSNTSSSQRRRDGIGRDVQAGPKKVEVVTFPRPGRDSMLPESYGLGVTRDISSVSRALQSGTSASPSATSSVQILKLSSLFGPKVVTIATSAASRPRAISTRPILGMLFRGSNMYHPPPI